MPPARRVRLMEKDAPPVKLEVKIEKPGTYTLYVTASMRWNGSGSCADPSEQPIQIRRFHLPDALFGDQRTKPTCDKVRFACRVWCGRVDTLVIRERGPLPPRPSLLLLLLLLVVLLVCFAAVRLVR